MHYCLCQPLLAMPSHMTFAHPRPISWVSILILSCVCAWRFRVVLSFQGFQTELHTSFSLHTCLNSYHTCLNSFHTCLNLFHTCLNSFHTCLNSFHTCLNSFTNLIAGIWWKQKSWRLWLSSCFQLTLTSSVLDPNVRHCTIFEHQPTRNILIPCGDTDIHACAVFRVYLYEKCRNIVVRKVWVIEGHVDLAWSVLTSVPLKQSTKEAYSFEETDDWLWKLNLWLQIRDGGVVVSCACVTRCFFVVIMWWDETACGSSACSGFVTHP